MGMNNSPSHKYGDIWSASNIRRCQYYVFSMQGKMDKAVATGSKDRIRFLTWILSKSQAVRILAIHHIATENEGRNTAGVDKVSMKGIRDKKGFKTKLLNQVNLLKKPSAIRRVYIPKPNGKKRPLGIPTMQDRIVQDVIRMCIEPITEYNFSDASYGFRPKRSCHDAIGDIFIKLADNSGRKKPSFKKPEWIVEGDIKGCFDNISHDHIVSTMREWKMPSWIISIVSDMLKAEIWEKGYSNKPLSGISKGTPQGGVISPMLCNIAMTALDKACKNELKLRKYTNKEYNPIVRYADDFIVACQTKEEADTWVERAETFLKDKIGLTLSREKTKIVNIKEGFDFLGFNIKKYEQKSLNRKPKLLIKPAKEKVKTFLDKCQNWLNKNKQATSTNLTIGLNQRIKGWGLYYRFVVSKETFNRVDYELYHKTFRWAKRRHPKKTKKWVLRKYFLGGTGKRGKPIYRFHDGFDSRRKQIELLKHIPIKRFVKVKNGMRVYDEKVSEYWKEREYKNTYNQIYSNRIKKVFMKQKGTCPMCRKPIVDIGGEHPHHIIPKELGGTDGLNNLQLLHTDCHRELHSVFTLKEMKALHEKNLRYWEMIHFILLKIQKRNPEAIRD